MGTVKYETKQLRDGALHGFSVILCFSVLYIAYFSPALFTGHLLAPGDGFVYYLPNFLLGIKLWDPLLLAGFPVAADPQAMTWYPLSIFFSLFKSWNGFIVSAYVLASSFTYGYVYTVSRSRFAAFASGIVYGMSGYMSVHLGHSSMVHAAAWMPLLIWTLEKLRGERRSFWFLAACLSVACCALAGHPQILVYSLGIGTCYALYRGWSLVGGRMRYYALAISVMGLGLTLAAVQLLPSAELAGLSLRSEMGFADFVSYSLPPRQSLSLLFPYLFGGSPWSFYGLPYFGEWNVSELSGYVGLMPLMVVIIGLVSNRKNSLTWFWASVGLLAFLLVLGDATPLAKFMYYVPVYNKFRVPSRNFLELALAVSVLAGLGIKATQEQIVSRRVIARTVIGGGVVMVSVFILVSLFSDRLRATVAAKGVPHAGFLPWSNPAVGIPLIIFILIASALVIWARKVDSRIRQALLLTVLILDLGTFGWFSAWKYGSPGKDELRPPPSARIYKALLEKTHQRMMPVRGVLGSVSELPPNSSRLFGIPSAGGYGPLMLSRFSRLLSIVPHGELTGAWSSPNDQSLDLASVRYVFVPKNDVESSSVSSPKGIVWPKEDLPISLGSGSAGSLPLSIQFNLPIPVDATDIGIVSSLGRSVGLADDTEVIQALVTDVHGRVQTLSMSAGRDTSEWAFDCTDVRPLMKHSRATVYESFPVQRNSQQCEGHRYLATLPIGRTARIKKVEMKWAGGPLAAIEIRKVSLFDKMTGRSYPLSLRTSGLGDVARWRHIEDIGGASVYENLRAMPRAWLVPEAVIAKPEEILHAVKSSKLPDDRNFDPSKIALVEEPFAFKAAAGSTESSARVVHLSDKSVEVQTDSTSPAFLVLSDVYYPGWKATIDGVPTHIFQTDYLLRGVMVPPGGHMVHFTFRPRSLYIGSGITLATLGIIIIYMMISGRKRDVFPQSASQREQG